MKLKQRLAVIGAMGVAVGAAGCGRKVNGAEPIAQAQDTSGIAKYLGKGGQTEEFDKKLVASICQLEEANKERLEPSKRLCPDGNPEKVVIPTYPPK